MKVIETKLPGVLIIEPKVFSDTRGYFLETFQAERYKNHDMPGHFVQDNISYSAKGVLRGLHYQLKAPQGKLVWVLQGAVFDVALDVRWDSPTFGEAVSVELNEDNHRQLYIPPGYAHGFCVLSEGALFYYKCTDFYDPTSEKGVAWNDPELNIPWPVRHPILSPQDQMYPVLKNISPQHLLFL